MQGARRVITFCLLIAVLPIILLITPLYLRHSLYADVMYAVTESDIIVMVNGISSVFCQEHSLEMNSTFNAFQVKGPLKQVKSGRRLIQMKKSMTLPDDTLEYWGFYLPAGSTVYLSACSRYDGSRILVVKGEKNLRNCGLMQPTKMGGHLAEAEGNVFVKFEAAAPKKSLTEMELEEELFEGEVTEDPAEEESSQPLIKLETTTSPSENKSSHLHRHENSRKKHLEDGKNAKSETIEHRKKALERVLYKEPERNLTRKKRLSNMTPKHKLDGGVAHGGKALNHTSGMGNDSSLSSFETSLLTCYDGQILLSQGFLPSKHCTSPKYLETGKHMQATHEVVSDGYYYYIFYSDNDYMSNDIHAIFNIHKPTYQYYNYSVGCINKTECTFPISFLSDETVIVEVPTRDGIEHQPDDFNILVSKCHPRSAVYAIFPIAVLFLILLCSFV